MRVRDAYGNTFDLEGVYTTGMAIAPAEFGFVSEIPKAVAAAIMNMMMTTKILTFNE